GALVAIGVVLEGQRAVGAADLVRAGFARYAENVVVVAQSQDTVWERLRHSGLLPVHVHGGPERGSENDVEAAGAGHRRAGDLLDHHPGGEELGRIAGRVRGGPEELRDLAASAERAERAHRLVELLLDAADPVAHLRGDAEQAVQDGPRRAGDLDLALEPLR